MGVHGVLSHVGLNYWGEHRPLLGHRSPKHYEVRIDQLQDVEEANPEASGSPVHDIPVSYTHLTLPTKRIV